VRLTKSLVGWSLKVLVAIALLYLLFRFIPMRDVIEVMALANGGWVTAAFIVLVFERLSAAWRTKLLTDRLEMSLSVLKLWEINTISIFYSTFLPGDLAGGAVRWYRMSSPSGLRAQAFAALVVERLIDTIILVLFGLIFWFWDTPPFATPYLNLGLIGLFGGLMIGMVLSMSPRTSMVILWFIDRIPLKGFERSLSEKTEKVLESVRAFRALSFSGWISVVMLSASRHVLAIVMMFCFAQALGMIVDFSTIGWIRSLMNIVIMLPISFAGLGVREASYAVLLEPYGIPGSQAVALSLFAFVVHLALAVVGGLLEIRTLFAPPRKKESG